MPYAPATERDVAEMLESVGATSIDDLFDDIPSELRFQGDLDIPPGVGEQELVVEAAQLADSNVDMTRQVSFLGAGSYDHFVPAVVRAITSRSEFATAYTPYQAELSQGTLQSIFEFQTGMSRLTGLPVANASLYDGATATAEACYLAEQTTGRGRVLVLGTVSPHVRAVLRTYASAYGMQIDTVAIDPASGTVSVDAVSAAIGDDVAALVVQQPNALGRYEEAPALMELASRAGAVGVVHADPLSLGVLEAPGAYGAGVCVGDGQALGNAPSFGGPSFGFMAAQERFVRRMPGRIVGETRDSQGNRGYVLTFQTREQHIRRDKATSNICTNQALNALAGIVYLSWLGSGGITRLGHLLVERAARTRARLADVPGVRIPHTGPVFKEFLIELPIDAAEAIDRCAERGVHPGWDAARGWPELGPNALLVAVTEQRTDAHIEQLANALAEVVA